MDYVIEMNDIKKSFFEGTENEIEILHGIDLKIKKGEFVAIVGASGSGKSTLMNLIGVLDRPSSGEYTLQSIDISEAKEKELASIRNKNIGFVFQTYNLIGRTSAVKNVELPMLYAGYASDKRKDRAVKLLELVEMQDRANFTPDKLSGGEKQRIAIARALANEPEILLADEPTGALDSVNGRRIMDIFHRLHKEEGKTIVLITHSQELAEETERIVTIRDGLILGEREGKGRAVI